MESLKRTEEGFIDDEMIKSIMLDVKDESAQKIAETVYKNLRNLQNFHLHDDFTIVIFKKEIEKV